MLDPLTLRLLWLIIEQSKTGILPEFSDAEIVHYILEQVQAQLFLTTSELLDTNIYIRSRIPLIRDLAEIQSVKSKGFTQV